MLLFIYLISQRSIQFRFKTDFLNFF
uniref:Uncharacterized protein n=1 Tax=Anguilla anguilla TaxID=7936 RepID=A0A0E9TKN9_ANGAN